MNTSNKTVITVQASVNAPIEKVWDYWNNPDHITQWCSASDDWHTPTASNDLRTGGTFNSRMEARDGSMGFDFGGIYDAVETHSKIAYTIGDGRKVEVLFSAQQEGGPVDIVESFEAEELNPVEMQRGGWQAILDNFKRYTESH